jgi:hypothetical protein
MNFNNHSITLTYGDQAENHKGMQIIGQMAETGFNLQDLNTCKLRFEAAGNRCELIHLNQYLPAQLVPNSTADPAYVLVVRGGVNTLLKGANSNADNLFNEQVNLDWDSKAFMYGRVVNKHARHNLCYSETAQEPNYAEGKGRIIAFDSVPLTKHIRQQLPEFLPNSENLQCEGNSYFDTRKTGISMHGDSERKRVVATKLGDVKPLHFQWFYQSEAVGNRAIINLSHGDVYIMSEKAVGTDWKKKNIYTLRHATGADKYTTV